MYALPRCLSTNGARFGYSPPELFGLTPAMSDHQCLLLWGTSQL